MNKDLRKKEAILDTLPRAATESDISYAKAIYASFGNLIKNGYVNEANPATYVGWLKLEDGTIIRLEGEERQGKTGRKGLALKGVTVPNQQAVAMGMAEPEIPKYKSKETESFL